ncbi:MAG: LapA family protein [Candidatus Aminicenantes bacterium]|nr:LapA family protein [Candidatus Aminicenantes bacterium]
MKGKLILVLVAVAFVVLFVLQNTTVVEIHFLLWSLSMSRALLIVVFVAVGVIIGWLLRSNVTFKKINR